MQLRVNRKRALAVAGSGRAIRPLRSINTQELMEISRRRPDGLCATATCVFRTATTEIAALVALRARARAGGGLLAGVRPANHAKRGVVSSSSSLLESYSRLAQRITLIHLQLQLGRERERVRSGRLRFR